MELVRKYATATHVYFPVIKRGVVDFAVSADWTPAAGDVKISIDGGAASNVTNLPAAITMGNTAMWDLSLTTGEMTGKKISITVADASTKAVEDTMLILLTYGNASAELQQDLSAANYAADVQTIKTQSVTCAAGVTVNVNVGTTQAVTFNANNFQKVSLNDILATTLTETSGLLAGGFKQFFNVSTPTGTVNSIPNATAGAAGGLFIAGTNAATTVTTSFTTTFTGNLTGSVGSVSGAVGSVTGNVGGDVTGKVLGGGASSLTGVGVQADLQTIKTQTVTCAGGVTVPAATLASTANITAGTITTVTNLTNAPTAGDFTSTMKTSIGTAVAASAVASVTAAVSLSAGDSPVFYTGTATAGGASTITDTNQAFTTNALAGCRVKITSGTGAHQCRVIVSNTGTALTVDRAWATNPSTDSVYAVLADEIPALSAGLKVTGVVTTDAVTTVNGLASNVITAASIASDADTEIAGAVWDLATSGHTTSGTFGAAMNAAGSAGDPWATALPGAYGGGTAGFIVGTNLDALVSSRGTSTLTQTQVTGGAYSVQSASCVLGDARLADLDAAVSSRMATYSQPTGFLAATFPSGTVANTTNITAGTITTVTNLTNAPTAGDFTSTMKTSLSAATPAVTVSDKTGFALTSAYDFAKGTVAMTESYAANGATTTPAQALYAIQQYLTTFAISGTSYTVKKLDGSTSAFVVTLNDGTTPTAATRS